MKPKSWTWLFSKTPGSELFGIVSPYKILVKVLPVKYKHVWELSNIDIL